MKTLTQPALPTPWPTLSASQFFESLSQSSRSALLLDFDGTLAPFRIDPTKVRPWAGITALLNKIHQQGRTRIAIVSGRPAQQVKAQLNLDGSPEVFGLHGAEHLLPDGTLHQECLSSDQFDALKAAKLVIAQAGLTSFGARIEVKSNAIALHWRGNSPISTSAVHLQATQLLEPLAKHPGLTLLHFNGGIELRAGSNKGHAVRTILDPMPPDTPAAYLGDDTTDEDAFLALNQRPSAISLSILVRRQPRPSAAQLWLHPPTQLRDFLSHWLQYHQHPPTTRIKAPNQVRLSSSAK